MYDLTKLAQKIEDPTVTEESAEFNDKWAAHKDAFAAQEAAQEAAAYEAEMAEEKALGIGETIPPAPVEPVAEVDEEHGVLATPARLRRALDDGGRAEVTLRSHQTGKHVTVVLICRKKKSDGKGWIPRTTSDGRVGFAAADCIEARDPQLEYPENYVGRFYKDTGEFKAGKDADGARVFTAEKLISSALSGQPLKSDVFIATTCCACGKKLTDPESIEDGIGPECKGKATKSQAVPHA